MVLSKVSGVLQNDIEVNKNSACPTVTISKQSGLRMSSERSRGGGVLPISAAATRKHQSSQAQAKAAQRAPAPRLRLIIRRLPPGLTESEFWIALGNEWQLGKGKMDWAAYKDGKVSKEYASHFELAYRNADYFKVLRSLLDQQEHI